MISTEGIQHLYNAENKIKLPDIRCNSGEGLIILGIHLTAHSLWIAKTNAGQSANSRY